MSTQVATCVNHLTPMGDGKCFDSQLVFELVPPLLQSVQRSQQLANSSVYVLYPKSLDCHCINIPPKFVHLSRKNYQIVRHTICNSY